MYLREGLIRTFAKHADLVACQTDNESLTYHELEERSSRLVHWWNEHPADRVVPLLCTNRIDDVVVHVAALRAGKQLLLLDSREPGKRIQQVLKTQRASRVFSANDVDGIDGVEVCKISDCVGRSDEPLGWYGWELDDLAWMYYTSGSTGEPKGVPVPYRRRIPGNFMSGRVDPGAVVVATRPFSFLAGGTSLLETLRAGAQLHPIDISSGHVIEILDLLREKCVDLLTLPPSFLRSSDQIGHLGQVPTCREISLTGERSTAKDLRKLQQVFCNAVLHNSYGSTELGTIARHRFLVGETIPEDPLPVGSAFDCTIHILQEDGKSCETGEVGEVVVVSLRRTTSYSVNGHDAPLREVELPSGEIGVATGDAGFFDEDGLLRVIGRIDDIAKINGQLVNTTAVQQILLRHQAVVDAEILPIEGRNRRTKLSAVVVLRSGETSSPRELREFLLAEIPQWMIPSRFNFVDEIPRNMRGKTDRMVVLELASQSKGIRQAAASMGDPVIWKLLLMLTDYVDIDGFDVDTNLQSCGLDSLDAIEFLERINQEFNVRLPVSLLAGEWSLNRLRNSILDGGSQSKQRIVTATTGDKELELYWLMPGTNLVVGMPLASYLRGFQSKFFIAKGAESREPPHLNIDLVAAELIEQFVRQMDSKTFAFIGFSSAGWIVQQMAVVMNRIGIPPAKLVLIDPPLGESVSIPSAPPSPDLLMRAREGQLLTSRTHDADVNLLTLQTFGLRHHQRQSYSGKTLVVSTETSPELRSQITDVLPESLIVNFEAEHLELMRNPSICGPVLSEFLA